MDDSDETRSERQSEGAAGRMPPRAEKLPAVLFVPGLMAVRLKDAQGRAWLSRAGVAAGGLQRLALGSATGGGEVKPDGLIPAAHRMLIEHLRASFEVIVFPYDWRRSALEAGAGLAAAVRSELRRHSRPIHLLAHSSGGLVARAMIAQDGAAWDQVCGRGGRLVMLGTPHGGSYAVLQLLAGTGRLAQMLAMLDPKRSRRAVAAVMRSFPGLFELLPEAAALEGWEAGGWQAPEVQQLLSDARQVRASLQGAVDPAHMCCVAGIGQETPCGVRVGEDGRLKFLADVEGDGAVASAAAGLSGVPAWCVAAAHGDMPRHEAVLRATVDLLRQGATDALPRWFPAGAAGPAFELPDKAFIPDPDEWELLAAALGASAPGRAGRETYPLRVSVAHGSLQYARFPVAVGHYRGDVIVGAERFLDGRLGGQLTRRQQMNLYPGDVGTAEVLLAPGRTPPGGLVIGLGAVGEIAPEVITRGVMEAALRLALEIAESRQAAGAPGWGSAALSALLIGTGGGRSLSIENSVAAIVKGVILANRALRERGLWDRARIDEVEFIELYQDLATRAAYAVRNLGSHLRIVLEEQEIIEPAVHLQHKPGGLTERPANEFATGWWRRLQVSEMPAAEHAPGAAALQFVLLTDQARAEERLEPTQRALVDQIIERTIRDPFNQDLPATLYELLLPNSLKELTYEVANLQLVLDSGAARYPWEMLAERAPNGVASPIANSMGVLRQLRTAQFRAQVQYARGGALVIGEPYTENRALYPPLPGAAAEAEAVARLLEESGYRDVVRLIGREATALKIVDALFAREYRIIHIAAHGVYDPDHPEASGVVIGDGVYLTPAELAKLRVLPELVFLNCCHLGKIDPQAPAASLEREPVERAWSRLAASVSGELIKLGVRAVVAAGWAVDDAAANCFATEFYGEMLSVPGQPFGEAVWRARQRTYRGYAAHTNTWGAYQCYGDPGFAFGPRAAGAAAERQDPVAAHEIVRELEEIRRRAPAADAAGRAADLARVRWLIRTMPAGWRSGRLLCALAAAYAALGELGAGIAAYREAFGTDGSSEEIPLVTLVRLAELEARYALALRSRPAQGRSAGAAAAAPDPGEAYRKALLKDAAGRLEQWLAIARTPPHLALAGGIYRRLALAGQGAERTQALKRAAACCREAHEMQGRAGPAVDPSFALGWAACSWLSGGAAPDGRSRELVALIDLSLAAASETASRAPGFPPRVQIADGALLCALVEGNLDGRREEVIRLYREAFGAGAGAAERAAVFDQLDFLIEMVAWRGRGSMASSLRAVRKALEA